MTNALLNRLQSDLPSLYKVLIKLTGNVRQQEEIGLIHRAPYAYGMLRAADLAQRFGNKKVTVIEFGVASGDGLVNMVKLAAILTAETSVEFRVVGFDTGAGIPANSGGYKDHPEIWSVGDYPMGSLDTLKSELKNKAELIIGDIEDTVMPFLATLSPTQPIGFISVDVDIYTSAVSALKVLDSQPDCYNPAVSVYLDDIGSIFANRWCGELAAVEEFNTSHELRKIDIDRSILKRKASQWGQKMHVAHILDHPERNSGTSHASGSGDDASIEPA